MPAIYRSGERMDAEPVHHPSVSDAAQPSRKLRWGRVLILLGVGQMIGSTLLLLIAATAVWERPPRWGQILDVGLAFSVVVTGIAIDRAAKKPISSNVWRQSYLIATYLPITVMLGLWLGHRSFDFNFLTGVAWRLWLIVHVLPASIALWRESTLSQPSQLS